MVTDFLGALNICLDAGFVQARPNYNESLDVEGALLIESLQQRLEYQADMVTLVDLTQSVINLEGQSTKHFLVKSAVASIRRHFRRSNLRLARHFMGCDTSPFEERATAGVSKASPDNRGAGCSCRAKSTRCGRFPHSWRGSRR